MCIKLRGLDELLVCALSSSATPNASGAFLDDVQRTTIIEMVSARRAATRHRRNGDIISLATQCARQRVSGKKKRSDEEEHEEGVVER